MANSTIFKIRRDTAANWASENPTLASGEMGLDQTNNFIKMGDGTTAWNSLAQFTQNIENVEDLVGAMVTSNTETFITVTYDDSDGTLDFVVPVKDQDNMSSDSATHLATQQSIKAYVDAQVTAQDLDFQGDSGGALSIDLDSETLDIAGGTGIDTTGSGNEVSVAIDSTVATLTGSQTLTNKTLTSPVVNTGISGSAVADEDDMSSNSATLLATQQSIKAYVDSQVTAQDLDLTTDSGTIAIDLDSETLSILGGTGLSSSATGNAATIGIDATVATLTGSQTLTNKTLTSAVLNTGVSGSAILDEDAMGTNSATQLATQQSIKAYVDGQTTDETAEGSNNLYHTTARARSAISVTDSGGDGALAYNSSTGVITYTGPSASEVRAHISVTDSGGDGSLAYSAGVITYTGPSAAEVRAHLSAGTGVGYSSGAISIGQAVATDSDVQFADLVLSGDLTVNGTTTTVATTNMVVSDKLIELANGQSGTPSGDLGLVMERGSSDNVFIGFDESDDKFVVGTGSFTGASTGNLTITTGTLKANIEGATVTTTGNIAVGGTVDGRDVATDGAKLDLIEASATADQTGAQIKALYEAESSAFTDAQFTKLANIETAADVTDATNVNAAGALMLSDTTTAGLGIVIDEDAMGSNSATKVPTQQSVKAYVDAQVDTVDALSELSGNLDDIADGSTYVRSTQSFTPTLYSKLNAIEAAADVTDATNVEAAGAVMESGATASAKIPTGTTAQRDGSPSAGYFRWNTTTGGAEIYSGSAWGLVGGGNTTEEPLWEHESVVSSNYTITDGNNAISCGPIIINSGYSVTVGSGSSWAIV